jgi:hypothetical protein
MKSIFWCVFNAQYALIGPKDARSTAAEQKFAKKTQKIEQKLKK